MIPLFLEHLLPTSAMDSCEGFFYCYANWASVVTSGLFWAFALVAFAVVIYLATARYGGGKAFGFASFVLLIGGVWLSVLKLIAWWFGSTCIIIGVIGLVGLTLSESK